MKPLFKIYLYLFAGLLFIAACNDSDEEGITGFTIDTQEVTLGAIGGMEPVKVASGTKWVAKVNQPWVKVMPANGVGSTNCEIVVDSTLSNDVRHAVVTFVPEGQPKQELKIHQTGYGKMIGLDKYEIEANISIEDRADLNANAIELLSLPPSLKAYQYIRKPAINTVPAIHFRLSTKNFRFLKSRYTKPIPIMINKRVEYPH